MYVIPHMLHIIGENACAFYANHVDDKCSWKMHSKQSIFLKMATVTYIHTIQTLHTVGYTFHYICLTVHVLIFNGVISCSTCAMERNSGMPKWFFWNNETWLSWPVMDTILRLGRCSVYFGYWIGSMELWLLVQLQFPQTYSTHNIKCMFT